MNEKTKIDINGSIKDAVNEISQAVFGMGVILVILGFLFAPVFVPLFRSGYEAKYRTKYNDPDYPSVERKMRLLKIILWLVALAGWVGVVLSNVYWRY